MVPLVCVSGLVACLINLPNYVFVAYPPPTFTPTHKSAYLIL